MTSRRGLSATWTGTSERPATRPTDLARIAADRIPPKEIRVFYLHVKRGADDTFFQQAVVVNGARAWDINWYSFAGNEVKDGATLLQMLTTFEATD